jgi:hypothetical protein
MTDDINAISGEREAYVPCNEVPVAVIESAQDSNAMYGEDEGFVASNNTASAESADETDTSAVFGKRAGYVPGPCAPCTTTVIFDDFNRTVGGNSWGTPSGYATSWQTSGDATFTRSVDGLRGFIQTDDSTNGTGGCVIGALAHLTFDLPFQMDLDFEFFDIDPTSYQPSLLVQFISANSGTVDGYVQIFPKEGPSASGPEIAIYPGTAFQASALGINFAIGHLRVQCTTTGLTASVNGAQFSRTWVNNSSSVTTIIDPACVLEISLIQSTLVLGSSPSTYQVAIDNITFGTDCTFI